MVVDPQTLPPGFPRTEDDVRHTPPGVILEMLHQFLGEIHRLRRQVEHLEERLLRNSSNSDQPPSADPPFIKKTRIKKRRRRPGGKKGHPGHRRELLFPSEVVEIKPTGCPCGNDRFPDTYAYDLHQVVELPEVLVRVTHFVLYKGKCPGCGRTVKGRLPQEHRTGYGPRFTAMVGSLCGENGTSRGLIKDFCRSVIGVSISRGTIQKLLSRASAAIAPHYEAIGHKVRAAPVAHVDETTWWERGKRTWLWFLGNAREAFFLLHPDRSREGFRTLAGSFKGQIVSDDYVVYIDWPEGRQSCLAHLMREAKGLSEKKEKTVARFGKAAHAELLRLCRMAHVPPTWGEWRIFYARFVRLLTRGVDMSGEAGKFVARLLRNIDSLWLFLEEPGVEPTNNLAERCLRFPVIWRKGCFGTQNEWGNRWVERILSLRQTCRLRGMRTFPLLVEAIGSLFRGVPPDLSWITTEPMPQVA